MKDWWKREVGYQIYPKSFKDSNHDGIGDLKGITSKLDYLKDLGITLIWICPIFASPMQDNGYDISDYYAIHPDFGTMEDLDELILEAKKRDIKIMLDLVVNHTSYQHHWFQEALKDPNSPYRDYYTFKKGKNGKVPNNWRSVFGGSVWENVEGTDDYYYHTFASGQPDLNWENPQMREDIYKMINWWLEKGIAGFRVDAINFMKKDQSYQDGPIDGVDGLSSCFPYSRNLPGIEVFFKELREKTFDLHNCATVAEAVGVPYKDLGIFIGDEGCFSMMFDFNYTNFDISESEDWFQRRDWSVKQYKDMLFESQREIQKIGWSAPFLENHDQPRSIDKLIVNKEDRNYYSITMLGCMFFYLRGTPFIYQGEEIGMCNFERTSIDDFDDINSHAQYHRAMEEGYSKEEALHFLNLRSRDNTRTPMHWNDKEYAGFSDHQPWIKMNPNYTSIHVEQQLKDNHSVFHFYQKMIQLRQDSPVSEILIYGDFIALDTPDQVIAYQRKHQGNTVTIYCNFTNQETAIDIIKGTVMLNNYDEVNEGKLLPYQCLVIA